MNGAPRVITDRHRPPPEPVAGEHLWAMLAVYRVIDPAGTISLDTDHLASLEGPECLWCEARSNEWDGHQPCPGRRATGAHEAEGSPRADAG